MKKNILLLLILCFTFSNSKSQGIGGILKKASGIDSNGKIGIGKLITKSSSNSLTNEDIISGLKEALRVGTDSSCIKLSKPDGFFGDAALKIMMPLEAQQVEKTLRNIGMGKMVDKAILSMNRAAEDAARGVGDIFWISINQMIIQDGVQILKLNYV